MSDKKPNRERDNRLYVLLSDEEAELLERIRIREGERTYSKVVRDMIEEKAKGKDCDNKQS